MDGNDGDNGAARPSFIDGIRSTMTSKKRGRLEIRSVGVGSSTASDWKYEPSVIETFAEEIEAREATILSSGLKSYEGGETTPHPDSARIARAWAWRAAPVCERDRLAKDLAACARLMPVPLAAAFEACCGCDQETGAEIAARFARHIGAGTTVFGRFCLTPGSWGDGDGGAASETASALPCEFVFPRRPWLVRTRGGGTWVCTIDIAPEVAAACGGQSKAAVAKNPGVTTALRAIVSEAVRRDRLAKENGSAAPHDAKDRAASLSSAAVVGHETETAQKKRKMANGDASSSSSSSSAWIDTAIVVHANDPAFVAEFLAAAYAAELEREEDVASINDLCHRWAQTERARISPNGLASGASHQLINDDATAAEMADINKYGDKTAPAGAAREIALHAAAVISLRGVSATEEFGLVMHVMTGRIVASAEVPAASAQRASALDDLTRRMVASRTATLVAAGFVWKKDGSMALGPFSHGQLRLCDCSSIGWETSTAHHEGDGSASAVCCNAVVNVSIYDFGEDPNATSTTAAAAAAAAKGNGGDSSSAIASSPGHRFAVVISSTARWFLEIVAETMRERCLARHRFLTPAIDSTEAKEKNANKPPACLVALCEGTANASVVVASTVECAGSAREPVVVTGPSDFSKRRIMVPEKVRVSISEWLARGCAWRCDEMMSHVEDAVAKQEEEARADVDVAAAAAASSSSSSTTTTTARERSGFLRRVEALAMLDARLAALGARRVEGLSRTFSESFALAPNQTALASAVIVAEVDAEHAPEFISATHAAVVVSDVIETARDMAAMDGGTIDRWDTSAGPVHSIRGPLSVCKALSRVVLSGIDPPISTATEAAAMAAVRGIKTLDFGRSISFASDRWDALVPDERSEMLERLGLRPCADVLMDATVSMCTRLPEECKPVVGYMPDKRRGYNSGEIILYPGDPADSNALRLNNYGLPEERHVYRDDDPSGIQIDRVAQGLAPELTLYVSLRQIKQLVVFEHEGILCVGGDTFDFKEAIRAVDGRTIYERGARGFKGYCMHSFSPKDAKVICELLRVECAKRRDYLATIRIE